MVLAEFVASLGIGRKSGELIQFGKKEPKLGRLAVDKFVDDFHKEFDIRREGTSFAIDPTTEEWERSNKRIDTGRNQYVRIIDESNEDPNIGRTVSIFIEGVRIDDKARAYRLITTAPKGKSKGEIYYAEYVDVCGERKPKVGPTTNTEAARTGANEALKLALSLASKPRN